MTGQANSVAVIGGGIVGVSTALFLNREGFKTTLFEKKAPGKETSYGNAGAVSQAAFLPINSPRVLRNLRRYASNRTVALRYDLGYVIRNAGWLAQFLIRSRKSAFLETAECLSAFAFNSRAVHLKLASEAGCEHRFRDTGWMKLYRTQQSFENSRTDQELMRKYGATYDVLGPKEIAEIEPHLKPVYAGSVLITSASNVDSPGLVTEAYAGLFGKEGGTVLCDEVTAIRRTEGGFEVVTDKGSSKFEQLVIAAGPWSKDLLTPLGYDVPMAYERGYHRHFRVKDGATIYRAMNDIDGGYSMSPMVDGIRVTSGIELAERDAPPNYSQIESVVPVVEQAFPLGSPVENRPWNGSRPSMPDSMPVIGPAGMDRGLWFAFGHAHIGFGTGPLTGKLVSQLVKGKPTDIDLTAFAPSRFGC
jgi:D-amino-acid dehydrogenase